MILVIPDYLNAKMVRKGISVQNVAEQWIDDVDPYTEKYSMSTDGENILSILTGQDVNYYQQFCIRFLTELFQTQFQVIPGKLKDLGYPLLMPEPYNCNYVASMLFANGDTALDPDNVENGLTECRNYTKFTDTYMCNGTIYYKLQEVNIRPGKGSTELKTYYAITFSDQPDPGFEQSDNLFFELLRRKVLLNKTELSKHFVTFYRQLMSL